jgi:thiol-disulfide isomerase/thioredoxin
MLTRLLLTLAAGLGCLSCASARPLPASRTPVHLVAEDLAGARVPVGGPGKVRLVDVWATWCEPCRGSMPRVAAVVRSRAAEGVEEIALSVDEELATVKRYLVEHQVEGRVLHYPGGMAAAQRQGLHGIPLFFVLDRQGRMAGAAKGNASDLERQLNEAISEALETPEAPAAASKGL